MTEHVKQDGTPDMRYATPSTVVCILTYFLLNSYKENRDDSTEGTTNSSSTGSSDSGTYKPSEHDGLKKDGTP